MLRLSQTRTVLLLALAALALPGCEKPTPVTPVAGIYAVHGEASVSWGLQKKPTVRRALPGMLLLSNMLLESDKGVVLEAFDGSFVWLPKGERAASKLKLPPGASEGSLRPIVVITAEATRKDVPPPLVASRYEQPPAKPQEVGENAELKGDFAFFFSPKSDDAQPVEEVPKGPPEPPWARKEKFIHALHRPLKAGDGARRLTEAKGAVVVEFLDKATAFADTLKLPVDLSDVKRVVVVDGSASLALPGGKTVPLDAGDIAEIQPLP
ncbi:MAG TPA: hypothetical protein VGK67_14505 [Myxococcales bacterium]